MSEEGFSINTNDTGEISASFSPKKMPPESPATPSPECEYTESQSLVSVGQDKQNLSVWQDVDLREGQNLTDKSSTIVNDEFGDPVSRSTPKIKHSTSAVLSTCTSDRAPLLKSRSSTTDSCIGCDIETESENSCGFSDQLDGEGSECGGLTTVVKALEASKEYLMMPGTILVPIVGHETMEARSKFTVFKIHVTLSEDDLGWFIFRRYSDFCHLNDQLAVLFPNFRLALPPKRWFRSNFDAEFLEERQLGLQAFLNNVTGHRDIVNSQPVRDFFCFDDPPGPHDSLEESRAHCESMEEMVYRLRKELTEKDTEMNLLQEELDLYKNQVVLLTGRVNELTKLLSKERTTEKRRVSTGTLRYESIYNSGDFIKPSKIDEAKNEDLASESPQTTEVT
ncbi:sorting nexin-16-like [Physella acuta]|uniref:sorting nexin-16-like n=1 Tax=Physella acuta TaxID=109671 RepID=UPI0027DBF79B|nr:sorting nexin-16-like [Physella acuta]XP_059139535.1 sorting nexin-16-like [Physella acuta]